MTEGIKRLPKDFIGNGEVKEFQFHQLLRGQKYCLYQVTTKYGSTHYEVFKIRLLKKPKTREPYEAYPKANSFGAWAWTYTEYENAVEIFKQIENYENY